MRARGQVIDQRGGGVLHDHESGIRSILVANQECRQAVVVGRIHQLVQAPLGNRCEHGNGSLEVTHGQCQGHTVEMSGRDHLVFDVARIFGIRKHQRIVGDRIQLDIDDPAGLHPCIANGAVNLRHATQAVGILRLMLLAALEWQETLVKRLAAVALCKRYIVPTDVEAALLVVWIAPRRGVPGAEARNQVIGNVDKV